jgi:hypothetical protein
MSDTAPAQAADLVTVQIRLAVTVSAADWQLAYGLDTSRRKALVDDVRQYVLTGVQECAASQEGAIREVTAK